MARRRRCEGAPPVGRHGTISAGRRGPRGERRV